jgi:hypothetical protein
MEKEEMSGEKFKEFAKTLVQNVKILDSLIDELPPYSNGLPNFKEEMDKLIERNNIVDKQLKELLVKEKN